MNQGNRQPQRTLDEYIDGLTGGEGREGLEQATAASPELRDELRLQQDIDRSLRRMFSGGGAGFTGADLGKDTVGRVGPRTRWRWVGIAAAVALVTVAGLYAAMVLTADRTDRLGPIYKSEVAGGFVPREVCTDAAQFAGWTKTNYGESLYPSAEAAHDGVTLVGWSYGVAVTSYSGVLLARVDGKPVVVVVDKAADEGLLSMPRPEDGSLHSFRRRVGGLVLYEVSPLATARVLPLISDKPSPPVSPGG